MKNSRIILSKGEIKMANVVIDKKDEIVMKLIHYFVTNENYKPVIVNGIAASIIVGIVYLFL